MGEQLTMPAFVPERENPHPTHVDKILNPPGKPQDPPQEKPKNKGGRPPGSRNKKAKTETPPQTAQAPPNLTVEEELRKLKADYANAQQAPPQGAQVPPVPGAPGQPPPGQSFVITGHLAMIVVDSLIPMGLSLALNRFGWRGVTRKQLQLTEQERKDIEPIMDACVRELTANPWLLLTLSLAGAYASKIPARPSKEDRERVADLEKQLSDALRQLKQQQKDQKKAA